MELAIKPDFDRAMERMEAWWECRVLDRPPVTIQIRPERAPVLPEKAHATLRDRWLDFPYHLDRFEAGLDGAVFLAETFPAFGPNLGPDLCATVFGCALEFGERTSWSTPIVDSCRDVLDLQPDLDTPCWNAIREATEESLERGRGRWVTEMPDLHTNGDLVAALRDPQGMCLDIAMDTEGVRAACNHVTETAFEPMFEDLRSRIRARGQPCTTWTPFLHAGSAYMTSCDVICMISPEMFEEAILPSIRREMGYLERSLFHLDGPGAVRHLEALLACPELDGVQWIFGAGSGPARKWVDVYRRIQDAGKCIDLHAEDLDDCRAVAEHVRPEGVWFRPMGAYPREEAEDFIRWTERWAARRT